MIDAPAEAGLEESLKPDFSAWRSKGANVLATGSLNKLADGRWEVRFYLYDAVQGSKLDEWVAAASEQNLRMLAHRIADRIYDKLTGFGAFSARVWRMSCSIPPRVTNLLSPTATAPIPRLLSEAASPSFPRPGRPTGGTWPT